MAFAMSSDPETGPPMPAEGMGAEDAALAPLARLIYDEMNVEPRQMHVAIELAKWYLTDVRVALVKRDLRRPAG